MSDTVVAPETPRLKEFYRNEVVPELQKEFEYSNPNEVAKVEKVVVSMGVGDAARDSKLIDGAIRDLTLITGQKPKVTKAKKSVAQFHLREGQEIGAYVTLRADRMWEFLDRLLTLALPRIRDFRGISGKQFDGNGNYNFGLTEQSMFHEIDPDTIDHRRGMDITVVTSTKDDKQAYSLLKHLGFPFKED
jgi:large subunit ribosomal protein L5